MYLGEVFQAEGTSGAKELRQEHTLSAQELLGGHLSGEERGGGDW